jgi:hypothetical protein
VFSVGRFPSSKKVREGGYPRETWGAELEERAYRGLGEIAPPHSRAFGTSPSACHELRIFNGCCNKCHFV